MIGYVTIGTNDLERAEKFYTELLGLLDAKILLSDDRMRFYGTGPGAPILSICKPYDEKEATVGNGVMVALILDSTDKVDAFHAKALELGGKDEGAPGPRGDGGFYAGYFRDLDGNKLNAFCMLK